jgi:hypothetical protein
MSKPNKIRKRTIKKNIDAGKYANIETAETYDSELNPGESVYMEVETGEVVLTFANFVSSDALFEEEICWRLSPADYRRYRLMSCWLHTNFNVVCSGNNRPHTLQSLSKKIRLSVDETTRFVKRLTEMGLLVYTVHPDSDDRKKVYMMNPYVIRKRKSIHEKLLPLFTNLLHVKQQAKTTNKKEVKTVAQLHPEQAN